MFSYYHYPNSPFLKNERKIKSLNMHNCGIDDNMCDLIAEMILAVGIGVDEFLTDINLSNNDITTKGALLILGAIKQNHDVTSLSLKGNDIAEGVSRWLDEQIQSNTAEKGKESPQMKRTTSARIKLKKKESPSNSYEDKEKGITQAAVDNLRMEYDKLNAQVHALRAEIKRLEGKRSKLKKKDSKEKATTTEDTERDKIFDDSIFKLVDSSKIRIGRRVAPLGGSGASIFEAEVDGWTCALKEIVDLKFMNNATINSFEREIKILASLPAHPNVCRYLFASREDNVLRLFMSLYHGTVATVIRSMYHCI